jgi:hypothetical protein
MKKLALMLAASGCLLTVPAFADDICVGPACIGVHRDRDEVVRERHRDADCREVTVRERRGDDIVVTKKRTCD